MYNHINKQIMCVYICICICIYIYIYIYICTYRHEITPGLGQLRAQAADHRAQGLLRKLPALGFKAYQIDLDISNCSRHIKLS